MAAKRPGARRSKIVYAVLARFRFLYRARALEQIKNST